MIPRTLPVLTLAAVATVGTPAQGGRLTEPVASYSIAASFDPATHTIRGHELVTWRNRSLEPVRELWLHLYLNAFRNEKSTFMRETEGNAEALAGTGGWGSIEVGSIRVADGGPDLRAGMRFIQPDGNLDDATLAVVTLPKPIPAGASIRLEVGFTSRLPRAVKRTGYWKDFHFAGQWFPKVGVLEPAGERGRVAPAWNARQYHGQTEFYADHGDYDLTLTVPADHVVGATGRRVERRLLPDGRVAHRYVQEDVHDFAWAADPRLEESERVFEAGREVSDDDVQRAAQLLQRPPQALELSDVRVRLLTRPELRHHRDRIFRAAFLALENYGLWFGAYPYEQLTIVVPPRGARNAVGGMEHPTLVTIEENPWNPSDSGDPEMLTVHEIGHQWWYGLVANDEVTEPWIDEGLATYVTTRILDRVYGASARYDWTWGIPVPAPRYRLRLGPPALELLPLLGSVAGGRYEPPRTQLASAWRAYAAAARADPVRTGSWRYRDRSSYFVSNYWKPTLILHFLERQVGEAAVLRGLRTFFERHRFGHPTSDALVAALEEGAGRELRSLLDPLLLRTDTLDHAIADVRTERAAGGRYTSRVEVRRFGEVSQPTTVEAVFADGTTQNRPWDGQARWAFVEFSSASPLQRARLDPASTLVLDLMPANNVRTASPQRIPAVAGGSDYMAWFQGLLLLIGGAI